MKALLIDDEPSALETMQIMLSKYCPQVSIVGTASNIIGGLRAFNEKKPDIIFLDIHMPHGNGMELLEKLQGEEVEVVFTTAFEEYAIRAIRLSALDYLLKPIDPQELMDAIRRYEKKHKAQKDFSLIKGLISKIEKPKKIAIVGQDETSYVELDSILYLSSSRNYCNFHIKGRDPIVASRPLADYEELLQPIGFFRIHRSHVVNMAHVSHYKSGRGGYVIMSDNTELEVARTRKKELIEMMEDFLQ